MEFGVRLLELVSQIWTLSLFSHKLIHVLPGLYLTHNHFSVIVTMQLLCKNTVQGLCSTPVLTEIYLYPWTFEGISAPILGLFQIFQLFLTWPQLTLPLYPIQFPQIVVQCVHSPLKSMALLQEYKILVCSDHGREQQNQNFPILRLCIHGFT